MRLWISSESQRFTFLTCHGANGGKGGKKKKRVPTSQRTDYSLIASCSFLCVFDRKFNGPGC